MKKNNAALRIAIYRWINKVYACSETQLSELKESLIHIYDNTKDIELVDVCIDYTFPEESSNSVFKRPELSKLLSEINKHDIDIIVVYKLSHLSNDSRVIVECLNFFKANQISFYSVMENYDSLDDNNIVELVQSLYFSEDDFRNNPENYFDAITIPFESSYRMLDTLKYAALYFNKVYVHCPMFDGQTRYFSQDIFNHMKVLLDEKIVEVKYVNIFDTLINSSNFEMSEYIINLSTDSLGKESEEDFNIQLDLMYNPKIDEYLDGSCPDAEDIVKWTMKFTNHEMLQNQFLISQVLTSLYSGKNTASSYVSASKIYNDIVVRHKETIKHNRNINCMAVETEGLLLPNVKDKSFDDIINIRHNCSDALDEMRNYVSGILRAFDYDSYLPYFVENKVNKDIKDFNLKVKEGNLSVLRKLLEELKSPFVYAPIFASVFCNIPANLSAALSLGLISFSGFIEYSQSKISLKREPLYFRTVLN